MEKKSFGCWVGDKKSRVQNLLCTRPLRGEEGLPVIVVWTIRPVVVVAMMFFAPMRLAYVSSMFLLLFIGMEPGGHDRMSMSVPNMVDATLNCPVSWRGPAGGDKRNADIQSGVVHRSLSPVTSCCRMC